MTTPDIRRDDSGAVIRFTGRLVTDALHHVEAAIAGLDAGSARVDRLDLSQLEAIDTAGACVVLHLQRSLARDGAAVEIAGTTPAQKQLIETVAAARFADHPDPPVRTGVVHWVERIGHRTAGGWQNARSLLEFLGLTVARLVRTLLQPRRLRLTSLFAQMQETGINAVPIVALMGFLIGIVLAFQGAAQLRQFGAEVFVVDLIAISVLRELGILLTAIIVAGRSGSAYTAAIGSMKVNEEIDAMETLGLDPVEVLVLPRLIGLVLMLPVLGLIANISALIGGGLMSWLELGVSPSAFVVRFVDNTDVWHFIVGMIKAPVFAFIIATVACWQGFQVAGSADSVGQRTRASVVQAIFLVIVVDAVFSIFFAELGV